MTASRKPGKRKPAITRVSAEQEALRATAFRTSRRHNAAETEEDYVELIDDLIRERGEARSVDMAQRLGVSHVTVAKTIRRLRDKELIQYEPYRAIFLTPKGKSLAERCRGRHQQVVDFLVALGVSHRAAEVDAEGIEHHVSAETLDAMRRFTRDRRRGA